MLDTHAVARSLTKPQADAITAIPPSKPQCDENVGRNVASL